MGQGLVGSIMGLSKMETREDLKIAASSLLGNLKRREKDWVIPQAFHLVSAEVPQGQGNVSDNAKTEFGTNGVSGARAGSAKSSVPQPAENTHKIYNPKAAEFLPNQPPP